MAQRLVWLALAGGLGTLARYGLAGVVQRMGGPSSAWGTAVVNLTGCFLAGLLWVLFESRWPVSEQTRTVALVGFMGAFTTFSTLILESGQLARSLAWAPAAANVALQNAVGLAALFLGAALAKML